VAAARIPPGPLSYFSHWLATQVFWHGGNIGFQRLRRAEPEVFDLRLEWPFNLPAARRTPLLFAYSPLILPRPREWRAEHIHVCGYLFLDEVETYQPPPELAAFLAAGEPPVCVTFGSMISPEGGERAQAALHLGLERAGKRGLFLTGWGGTPTWGGARGEDSARWLHLPAAPHTWLLPRCQAVIHHGGAGTTAAGLRAGIPALVVPHAADQPFWGRRVAAIGAGLRPLPLDQLNPDAVAAALAQMDGAGMRARAAELGRLIRGEDGVSTAVRLIEARLETGG
jgi:UDP:flavonoid glycosyltransferase YjiC (YdhE family)